MPAAGAHLAVDLGNTSIAAVLHVDGQRIVLLLDGQPRMPSGVFADPDTGRLIPGTAAVVAAAHRPQHYIPDPLRHLAAHPPHTGNGDPVGPLAAVLAHLAGHPAVQQAGPLSAVSLSVPTGWGPRRRQYLYQAAERAGLPAPHLVAAPAAIAAYTARLIAPVRPGALLLVCNLHGGSAGLSVLQASVHGFDDLATTGLDPAGIGGVDDALASRACDHADADLWDRLRHSTAADQVQARRQLLADAAQARHTLAVQPRAAILLPEPHPPAVLTRDDLSAAAEPLLQQLPDRVDAVLAAADVDPAQLHQVILTTDGPPLPGLPERLQSSTGRAPVVLTDLHTVADGVLMSSITTLPGGTPTAAVPPRVRLTVSDLTAAIILGLCSLTLLIQTITTADVTTVATRILGVRLATDQLSLAAALAGLTTLAVAHLAPTTWLSGPPDPTGAPTTGTLLRRGYLGAAALTVIIAALYGLAAGSTLRLNTGAYLRWSLLAVLPLCAAAATIALTAPRVPAADLPAWLRRSRPPTLWIVLAAAGAALIRSAMSLTPPTDLIGHAGLVSRSGAAVLGIATAFTVIRQPMLRAIATPILAIGYATVLTVSTAPALTIGYVAAITWWTLTLTAHTVRAAYPTLPGTLRRLAGTTPPT